MNETDKQDVIIAPGVAESIVALAIAQVEGVAQIGSKTTMVNGGLLGALNKKTGSSSVLILEEEGKITVDVHLKLYYGYKLQEVAAKIRATVADALLTQACIEIDRVNITIDGIIFKV
ncbi:MAG: Asp23/Gls24 family envelope stress response protein [Coriobacteriales bacterium]|jgi:uncharacterized alkaline shock family protein YloU|nr:Asp23/Gls24 family envelope stress response protein [Coriobacteriales bacterium]